MEALNEAYLGAQKVGVDISPRVRRRLESLIKDGLSHLRAASCAKINLRSASNIRDASIQSCTRAV